MRLPGRQACLASCLGLAVFASQSCGGDATGPDRRETPPTITVTSTVDTIMDLGRSATLEATATDDRGQPVTGLQFTWSTSDASVVSVGAAGLATAEGIGTATITATAGGASGTIRLHVVDSDLEAVTAMTGDAFADALVGNLSAASSARVRAAWDACASGASGGNLVAVLQGVADIRGEAASATDPTDRASLSVLGLYLDRIERALGL